MTVGQQFRKQGKLRIMLYRRVLKRAYEVGSRLQPSSTAKLTDAGSYFLSWSIATQNAPCQKAGSVRRVSGIFVLHQPNTGAPTNLSTPGSIVELETVTTHLLREITPGVQD
jgi:hypothetical protein